MHPVLVAHLVAVAAYAGFQWTVRLVVYPQFAGVPPGSFTAYERSHQRRLSTLVGPLFAGLVVTHALLLVQGPPVVPRWAAAASALLLAVVLGVTAFLAVPLHRRLGDGWQPAAHRSLLRVDTLRVAAATADVVLAVVLCLRQEAA